MKKQMIISILSKDRPGIIAGITGAIYELEGDVADLNQSILCNYLTMILSVSFDAQVTREDVLAAISHVQTDSRFEVSIKEVDDGEYNPCSKGAQPETYILTVQGPNKIGIVHGVSKLCYEHNINVLDLATTLQDDQYTMALQLDLQDCTVSLGTLQETIDTFGRDNQLHLTMQHNDIFQVTNEITLH